MGFDTILIAHGTLTDQAKAQTEVDYALAEIATNGNIGGVAHDAGCRTLRATRQGAIAVIFRWRVTVVAKATTCMAAPKRWCRPCFRALRQRLAQKGCRSPPSSQALSTRP